jgi:hypothetical protein
MGGTRVGEHVKLMLLLKIKFNLDCTIQQQKINNKYHYLLYIRESSMNNLRTIVTPFIPIFYIKSNSPTRPGP